MKSPQLFVEYFSCGLVYAYQQGFFHLPRSI